MLIIGRNWSCCRWSCSGCRSRDGRLGGHNMGWSHYRMNHRMGVTMTVRGVGPFLGETDLASPAGHLERIYLGLLNESYQFLNKAHIPILPLGNCTRTKSDGLEFVYRYTNPPESNPW